jgi:hypothetical protein
MGLITRQIGPNAKGSKLTFTEMDNNLYYLQGLGVNNISYSSSTLTLTNPTGGTKTVTINDYYTTGATYSNGLIYFNRNDQLSAYTANISSLTGDANTFITAVTYTSSANTITLTDNTNNSFNVYIDSVSGLTVNGSLSATTLYGDGSNLSGVSGGSDGLFNLPVPNLKIINTSVVLQTFDTDSNSVSSGVTLLNSPVITATDLTNEQISQGVWIEILIYRRSAGKRGTTKRKKGMVVPPSWEWDSVNLIGTNPFENEILSICPSCKLSTRGGNTKYFKANPLPSVKEDLHISRPNHYKLTGNTQSINVGYFLNGRFTYKHTQYRSPNNFDTDQQILLPIPVSKRFKNLSKGSRFCYRSQVTPTYVKFRYIMFNNNTNGGQGGFITGPTTNTIKIMLNTFPFVPNEPYYYNNKYLPTCTVKDGSYTILKCSIENNVP